MIRRVRSRSSVNSPPREAVGPEPPQKQIGVGHGGLGSAAVANGAGVSAGRFRAHAQQAAGIEACKRSAACAHGVNFQHGHAHGEPSYFRLIAGADLTLHGGHVGRGASHVERQNFRETAAGCRSDRAHQSAGGARQHGADGFARGGLDRGDSAAGLHDEDSRSELAGRFLLPWRRSILPRSVALLCAASPFYLCNSIGQLFHVALHQRLEISIHDDRAGAFVFPELGQDLCATQRAACRESASTAATRASFSAVRKREQERDRDGRGLRPQNRFPQFR